MLISCKCLNFVASSKSQQQQQLLKSASNAAVASADGDCSMSSNGGVGEGAACSGNSINAALMQAFLQKYPRNFFFYSLCMDFFKQSIGPIPDLSINAISQRELIFSLTLDVPVVQAQTQSWQLSICINCNAVLCVKRLYPTGEIGTPQVLVNSTLLTTNDDLVFRRADKAFSEAFGILIMDHPHLARQNSTPTTPVVLDAKQQRVRQLQHYLQQRLKREIAETDERIMRYTDQQFSLLKSFREKSEQEYDLLAKLMQRVPEQQAIEWFDQTLPALEVSGGGNGVSFLTRRRNTIGSRRDLSTTVTTPTTPTITTPNPLTANMLMLPTAAASAINATNSSQQQPMQTSSFANSSINANRKMSNFDTPPATPEATPMSVGNSPTFRQQQQQLQQQQPPQQLPQPLVRLVSTHSFQQQFPTPTVEIADDCLFELEGVDAANGTTVTFSHILSNIAHQPQQQLPPLHQHQQQYSTLAQQHFQRSLSNHQESNMSDLDESDAAEEAEDALDMDSSMPIPMQDGTGGRRRRITSNVTAQMLNFAKSLPIEIANSPLAERGYQPESDEDELDNTVDIAASIKALAKSVHGEAVFGDLPRPRLRSQI